MNHVRYVAERIGASTSRWGRTSTARPCPPRCGDAAGLPRLVEALRDTGLLGPERRRGLLEELAPRARRELHGMSSPPPSPPDGVPGGLAPARCRSSLDRRCTSCPRTDVSAWAADTPDRRDWPPATWAGALPRLNDSKAALGRVDDPPEGWKRSQRRRPRARNSARKGAQSDDPPARPRWKREGSYVDPSGRSGWKPPLDARSRGPECPPLRPRPGRLVIAARH